MSRNRTADVAVIGGGAVGVCAALELARDGASVVLLERGADLAWGCSAGDEPEHDLAPLRADRFPRGAHG